MHLAPRAWPGFALLSLCPPASPKKIGSSSRYAVKGPVFVCLLLLLLSYIKGSILLCTLWILIWRRVKDEWEDPMGGRADGCGSQCTERHATPLRLSMSALPSCALGAALCPSSVLSYLIYSTAFWEGRLAWEWHESYQDPKTGLYWALERLSIQHAFSWASRMWRGWKTVRTEEQRARDWVSAVLTVASLTEGSCSCSRPLLRFCCKRFGAKHHCISSPISASQQPHVVGVYDSFLKKDFKSFN